MVNKPWLPESGKKPVDHTECGHLLGQGLSYVGDGTGLLTIDST